MLKIARKTPALDERMDTIARQVLYYAVILHILFAIWTYGNSDIFEEDTGSSFDWLSMVTDKDTTDFTTNVDAANSLYSAQNIKYNRLNSFMERILVK